MAVPLPAVYLTLFGFSLLVQSLEVNSLKIIFFIKLSSLHLFYVLSSYMTKQYLDKDLHKLNCKSKVRARFVEGLGNLNQDSLILSES